MSFENMEQEDYSLQGLIKHVRNAAAGIEEEYQRVGSKNPWSARFRTQLASLSLMVGLSSEDGLISREIEEEVIQTINHLNERSRRNEEPSLEEKNALLGDLVTIFDRYI